MAFAEARTRLAADLAALTLTNPAMTIKKVHERPVSSLKSEEMPCFVMALPELREPPIRSVGYREATYFLTVGLFVQEEKTEQAALVLDGLRDAVIDALDLEVTLERTCVYCEGPRALPANAELFAGITYPHVDFEFEILIAGPEDTGA